MNKGELVNEVSKRTSIAKKKITNIIDTTTEIIKDALSEGEKVTLVGFGTFQVMQRKTRRGVNPQTGKELQIALYPYRKAEAWSWWVILIIGVVAYSFTFSYSVIVGDVATLMFNVIGIILFLIALLLSAKIILSRKHES